jgi:hypothetical protein
MASSDVPILEDLEFKEFWEDHLTNDARRTIRRAVRRGEALEDRGLASLAVSLARRYQRGQTLGVILYSGMSLAWVTVFAWLMTIPPSGTVWIWRIIAAVWVAMFPAKLAVWRFVQRPRFQRAEQQNLRRVQGQAASNAARSLQLGQ